MSQSIHKISNKLDKIFYSLIPKEFEGVSNALYSYSQFASKLKLHKFLMLPPKVLRSDLTETRTTKMLEQIGLKGLMESIEATFDEMQTPEQKIKDQIVIRGSNFKILFNDLFKVNLKIHLNPAQAINDHEDLTVINLIVFYRLYSSKKTSKKKTPIKIQQFFIESVEFYKLEDGINGFQHVESTQSLERYFDENFFQILMPNLDAFNSDAEKVEALKCSNALEHLETDYETFLYRYVAEILTLKFLQEAMIEFFIDEYME